MSPSTRALLAKDVRELRPWALLCLALALLELVSELLEQPDMRPLGATITSLHGASSNVMWLLAFAIGTGLGAREQDEGTLGFLDGLPVSRARVLCVKVAVALGMLLVVPTVSLILLAQLHLLSRDSLDASFEPRVLLSCYALQAGLIAQGVIVGTAMGFLRSLTWLVGLALGVGLSVLAERVPRAAVLSPFSLASAELTPHGVAVGGHALATQAGLTLLCALVAVALFMSAGRRSRLDLDDKPKLRALVSAATAVALVLALASYGQRMVSSEQDQDGEHTEHVFVENASELPAFRKVPAQTATAHYRISYPAERAAAALALAGQADAIFERVHASMRVPKTSSIDVDASGSIQNTEGTAFFGRLRLRLGPTAHVTLAHETAHVVAQRVVGERRTRHWRAARTLDEGLATWVEQRLDAASAADAADTARDGGTPEAAPADEASLLLSALHARRELSIEELADPAMLEMRRDGDLKYPAGAALIAALVRLYGEDAIPRLLRAFGDPKLPNDLNGLALWEAAFQRAGLDLGRVTDELLREIAKHAEQHAEVIAALARPRVRVVRDSAGMLGVQAIVDGAADTRVSLRFKPTPESGLHEIEQALVGAGMASMRDHDSIQDERICVQAGLPFARRVLYEPWVCLPTADAVRWDPPQPQELAPDIPE